MLLIDRVMGVVLSVCDRLYVLEFGKVIAAGAPDVARKDQRGITAYLASRRGARLMSGPVLAELSDRRCGLLWGGEQQMLAVGRALARHPRLLLLDELGLGLAPLIVERLLPVVREYDTESGCGGAGGAACAARRRGRGPRLRALARRARSAGPREGPAGKQGPADGKLLW